MTTASNTAIETALRRLIDANAGEDSGRNTALIVFIDPGSGDIYLHGLNNHRMCIEHDKVIYCTGEWQDPDAERTEYR